MTIPDEAIEAFGQAFWAVNARSHIDAHREELREALAAALPVLMPEREKLRSALATTRSAVKVLRIMLHKEGLRLGTKRADAILAEIAAALPAPPEPK